MGFNAETGPSAQNFEPILPGFRQQLLPPHEQRGEGRGIQQHNTTPNGNSSQRQVVPTDTPTQHQNQLSEQTVIQSLDKEDGSLFFQTKQQWASES